jgi:hypothetical protein
VYVNTGWQGSSLKQTTVLFAEGCKVLRSPSKKKPRGMFPGVCFEKYENRWSRIKNRLQKHTPENTPLKIESIFLKVVGARPNSWYRRW